MKLIPIFLDNEIMPTDEIQEYRFKKHNIKGKIKFIEDLQTQQIRYYYEIDLPSERRIVSSLNEGYEWTELEEARQAAEDYINVWYYINARKLALF